MTRQKARKYREAIETGSQSLPDDIALEVTNLFPCWNSSSVYQTDQRAHYENVLYRCLQDHTAQEGWDPVSAPSLWAKVLIPDESTIPAWEQTDSTNPYAKGDKVTHNGKIWVSDIDGNVWEPGVYGWTETTK